MYTRMIKMEDAVAGMEISEPVYITTTTGSSLLAARKGMVLDENLIKMLTTRKVQKIEVFSETPPTEAELPPAKAQAAPTPPPAAAAPPQPPKPAAPPPENYQPVKKLVSEKLKEDAVDSVKQLFDCFAVDGNVNKTTAFQSVFNLERVVGDLLGVITSDDGGLLHINDLKDFDEYTYHHSLSVSMLSMNTGREMGLDADTIFRLGRAAMMHDIGKQMIPLAIINKKGKLSDDEYKLVKNHSMLGATNLRAAGIGDVELWNGIMFHHEKIDGTGYPKGIKGKDIPIFSKIISVADVYDAVTSYRSYRLPMSPSEAFDIISREINKSFDLAVVKAFFAKLELYPINTIVELSDNRLGMVVESEGASRLRPCVRIWGSTEVINLAAAGNKDVNIVAVMNPADLPPGYEFQ